jgi:PKD repeat protein
MTHSRPPRRPPLAASRRLVLASALVIALLGLSLVAPAAAADETAPTFETVSKVNDTAIQVTIADTNDTDESTISPSDFELTSGTIVGGNVSEAGSNATIVLLLDRRLNVDKVDVAVGDDAGIQDTAGNGLGNPGDLLTVADMDGVAPTVTDYAVSSTGGTIDIDFSVSEPLAGANVVVAEPASELLTLADFEESGSFASPDFSTTYDASNEGTYIVTLVNVTDESGNVKTTQRRVDLYVDASPPEAVAQLTFAASADRTIAFDASRSSDESGLASYEWDLGDGTTTDGATVTHTYAAYGSYDVSLTVTDVHGNTATDTVVVETQRNATNATGTAVSLTSRTPRGAFATVRGATAGTPVVLGSGGSTAASLAGANGAAVQGLSVTASENASYDLALSADNASDRSAFERVTGHRPITELTLVHGIDNANVSAAAFEFTVSTATLRDVGAGTGDVVLYRQNGSAWTALETTHEGTTNGTARYNASSPGLSRFVIAADADGEGAVPTVTPAEPTPTATTATATATTTAAPTATATATPTPDRQFEVTAASINATNASVGDTITVNVSVENTEQERAIFVAGLAFNGTTVGTGEQLVPPGGTVDLSFTHAIDRSGTHAVSVNGTSAGTLRVAGESQGVVASTVAGVLGFFSTFLGTVILALVGIVSVIYLVLKALAIYLGY